MVSTTPGKAARTRRVIKAAARRARRRHSSSGGVSTYKYRFFGWIGLGSHWKSITESISYGGFPGGFFRNRSKKTYTCKRGLNPHQLAHAPQPIDLVVAIKAAVMGSNP